jgi:hypothetical protein
MDSSENRISIEDFLSIGRFVCKEELLIQKIDEIAVGLMPVPPAIMTISPEGISPRSKPQPLGLLILMSPL